METRESPRVGKRSASRAESGDATNAPTKKARTDRSAAAPSGSESPSDSRRKAKEPHRRLSTSGSLVCSLKSCSREILPSSERRVDIQIGLPLVSVTSSIRWTEKGEATFHDACWTEVAKSTRARNPRRSPIPLTPEEKALVKEAAKTAEFHDSFEQVERESARIAQLLQAAKHCIVFTGAGISTSAGIGDYRGKGGKWTEMDRETLTAKVTENLKEDVKEEEEKEVKEEEEEGVPYEKLRPTYTHESLVKLLEMGLVKYVISQNGDGLHALSGIPPESISELHGNVFVEACELCGHRYHRPWYVLDDNASLYYEELADNGSTDVVKPRHAVQCRQCGLSHRTGRRCEQKGCGGFLKDSIINFGDDLEEEVLSRAEHHAKSADLCLSLGTTMQVTPACNLVEMGRKPLRLVIVNRQGTGFDELCHQTEARRGSGKGRGGDLHEEQLGVRVFGDCDSVMCEVMRRVVGEVELDAWEEGRLERLKEYDSKRQS